VKIFKGQEKLQESKKAVAKPKKNCKQCNGTGTFYWQPSISDGIFAYGKKVICPCVKAKFK